MVQPERCIIQMWKLRHFFFFFNPFSPCARIKMHLWVCKKLEGAVAEILLLLLWLLKAVSFFFEWYQKRDAHRFSVAHIVGCCCAEIFVRIEKKMEIALCKCQNIVFPAGTAKMVCKQTRNDWLSIGKGTPKPYLHNLVPVFRLY